MRILFSGGAKHENADPFTCHSCSDSTIVLLNRVVSESSRTVIIRMVKEYEWEAKVILP
jgi:hypothetical protein